MANQTHSRKRRLVLSGKIASAYVGSIEDNLRQVYSTENSYMHLPTENKEARLPDNDWPFFFLHLSPDFHVVNVVVFLLINLIGLATLFAS